MNLMMTFASDIGMPLLKFSIASAISLAVGNLKLWGTFVSLSTPLNQVRNHGCQPLLDFVVRKEPNECSDHPQHNSNLSPKRKPLSFLLSRSLPPASHELRPLTCLLTLHAVNFATALRNEVTENANEKARVFEDRRYRFRRCIRNERR